MISCRTANQTYQIDRLLPTTMATRAQCAAELLQHRQKLRSQSMPWDYVRQPRRLNHLDRRSPLYVLLRIFKVEVFVLRLKIRVPLCTLQSFSFSEILVFEKMIGGIFWLPLEIKVTRPTGDWCNRSQEVKAFCQCLGGASSSKADVGPKLRSAAVQFSGCLVCHIFFFGSWGATL